MKTIGTTELTGRMADLALGRRWMIFIGATEMLGVAALFLPRFRLAALVGLWPYAIGGLAVYISRAHSFDRLVPAFLTALLIPLVILWNLELFGASTHLGTWRGSARLGRPDFP